MQTGGAQLKGTSTDFTEPVRSVIDRIIDTSLDHDVSHTHTHTLTVRKAKDKEEKAARQH